ncbi:MAG: TlpA family protein disulfide reductase [Bacteroidetes bacterium]|nr:TlpA family protein disulfide reductase [Bacteroidota bacterium]
MKKNIITGFILFLIAIVNPVSGQENINFSIDLINGGEVDFSTLHQEGPVLVNFWALWCKPCRTEMKYLKKIYEKYSGKGLKILGINQDTPRSLSKVKSFVNSYGIEYLIGLDPNKKYFEMFNGQVVPYSLLYNKDGEIVYQHSGYLPGDEIELEKEIKKVLGEE